MRPVTRSMRRRCVRLQRWWRRRLAVRDPITLGPVRGATVWADGALFGLAALRDYVRGTGDTRHPVTRRPLTDRVRARLGVVDLAGRRARCEAERSDRELVAYLEREVADVAAQIVDDARRDDVAAAAVCLVQVRFPAFHTAAHDLGRAGGDVGAAVGSAVARLAERPGHLALHMIARSFLCGMLLELGEIGE